MVIPAFRRFGRQSVETPENVPGRNFKHRFVLTKTVLHLPTVLTPSMSTNPGPEPKVPRLIDEYDLAGIGDELEARWTRREDRLSLRELADEFNQRLVATALEEAGVDTLIDEVSHLYAVLDGREGSSGQRTQLERRLARAGVDVEKLIDDFVTYQAIRSYLRKYRDASAPSKDAEHMREQEARTIEQLRERTVKVTESKIDRLRNAGQLRLGPYRVLADVRILCESCGKQYAVGDLLKAESCECYGD